MENMLVMEAYLACGGSFKSVWYISTGVLQETGLLVGDSEQYKSPYIMENNPNNTLFLSKGRRH